MRNRFFGVVGALAVITLLALSQNLRMLHLPGFVGKSVQGPPEEAHCSQPRSENLPAVAENSREGSGVKDPMGPAEEEDAGELPFEVLGDPEAALSISEDPPQRAKGARHFYNRCLFASTNRIELGSKEDVIKQKGSSTKVVSLGTAFIARDVCALGHFPKDLTHYFSYLSLEREATFDHFIIGHRCATKSTSQVSGKRTPVFHNVLGLWVEAITNKSFAGNIQEKPTEVAPFYIFYQDAAEKSVVYCSSHIVERDEIGWRWFPTPRVADAFRRQFVQFSPRLRKKTEEKRNVLLTVPFKKQQKLRILILRRDEDRHFSEAQVAGLLQKKFSSVAEIIFTQFDKPRKKSDGFVVPSYMEQLLALIEADVLIAAHGAGLSSVVVMRPGSVVIELFPHNFRYYMYEELSELLSLHYIPLEGKYVAPPGCCRGRENMSTLEYPTPLHRRHAGHLLDLPNGTISMNAAYDFQGKRACKKCDIAVSPSEWVSLVKSAISTVWLKNSRLSNVHDFDVRR